MNYPSDFPIATKWPAEHPDRIQLYSVPTPNGIKVSAMLEETGLPYEPHLVRFANDDQFSPEFKSLNPNSKIPAIIDPSGPNGVALPLWESGAILIYLAQKSGKLLPSDPAAQLETFQWLMWQIGGVGPMFGQFGYFHHGAGKDIAEKHALERYLKEARRLLAVLDNRLEARTNVMGDNYSIADIALWPWVRTLIKVYHAQDMLGMDEFANVMRWLDASQNRPASLAAVNIPKRD